MENLILIQMMINPKEIKINNMVNKDLEILVINNKKIWMMILEMTFWILNLIIINNNHHKINLVILINKNNKTNLASVRIMILVLVTIIIITNLDSIIVTIKRTITSLDLIITKITINLGLETIIIKIMINLDLVIIMILDLIIKIINKIWALKITTMILDLITIITTTISGSIIKMILDLDNKNKKMMIFWNLVMMILI